MFVMFKTQTRFQGPSKIKPGPHYHTSPTVLYSGNQMGFFYIFIICFTRICPGGFSDKISLLVTSDKNHTVAEWEIESFFLVYVEKIWQYAAIPDLGRLTYIFLIWIVCFIIFEEWLVEMGLSVPLTSFLCSLENSRIAWSLLLSFPKSR